MSKRILYISYFYPPMAGPAVLRNLKTVKYLNKQGFSADVITPSDLEYLYHDTSLEAQQHERKLFRTRSLDPMAVIKALRRDKKQASKLYMDTPERYKAIFRNLWPIDNKIGWLPFLINTGKKALKENDYDLIYISMGPFSAGLGAYHLSKLSDLPLVLDLRDYWTLLNDYEMQRFAWQNALSRHWEKKLYRHASLIAAATQGIKEDLCAAFGADLAQKCITVYNGWDEEDFIDLPEPVKEEGFVLAYFGNIYARRSLAKFYAAVAQLREDGFLPPNTKIKLYGNFFREAMQEATESQVNDLIEFIPQLDHRKAVMAMRNSQVLLLTLNSSGPRGTLSSKIFEYLRCQNPILAMVPAHNEAAQMLRQCGHDYICAMESKDSIYHCLKRLIQEYDPKRRYQVPEGLQRERQVQLLGEAISRL